MFLIVTENWTPLTYKAFVFSGGEVQVKFHEPEKIKHASEIIIRASLFTANDVMELLMVSDALRQSSPGIPIKLCLPYFPYARQDRVCYPGEALEARVMADLINSVGFAEVVVWDPHSDVTLALLRSSHATKQADIANGAISSYGLSGCMLVAPDAGALKKTMELAKLASMPYIRADKKRDPSNGEITGTVVYSEPLGSQDVLIVDDICDGGRTFIELAKELKQLTSGKIYLYVTHGIFSKGLTVFDGLIDHIYTAHVFPGVNQTAGILTVIGSEKR